MTTSTKTSLSEAIENYRQWLAHLQKVVDRHLSDITNDVLEGSPPKVSSVFGVRRATAIRTHLDAAKYSVNAALFYARDAKEEHDAE